MKKISTLLLVLVAAVNIAVAQSVKVYTGDIVIEVMGKKETLKSVPVEYEDNGGAADRILIKNLKVSLMGSDFAVGNITVVDVQNSKGNVKSSPKGKENNIVLTDGDDPTETWLGSALGGVQGEVTGTISGNKMSLKIPLKVSIVMLPVTLNIDFEGTCTETAIGNVVTESQNTAVYNLSGMSTDASAKGIVIKNGKKYLNK